MNIRIELNTDGAAFTDYFAWQIEQIMVEIGQKISVGEVDGMCRDLNGNRVGWWEIDNPFTIG